VTAALPRQDFSFLSTKKQRDRTAQNGTNIAHSLVLFNSLAQYPSDQYVIFIMIALWVHAHKEGLSHSHREKKRKKKKKASRKNPPLQVPYHAITPLVVA
jgi:hypothetical protein